MRKVDLTIGITIAILFSLFLMNIEKFVYGGIPGSISPVLLPKLIVALIVVLSIMIGTTILNKNKKSAHSTIIDKAIDGDEGVNQKLIVIYISILLLYLLSLYVFGFMLSTPLVMFAIMFLLGGRNMKVILPLVLISPPLFYYLCYHFLKVILPQGLFFV